MKSPRTLDDLPFASELRARPGGRRPAATASLRSTATTTGCCSPGARSPTPTPAGRGSPSARSPAAGFDGGRLRRARLSDVWFGETRLVAVDLAESSLTDTWFSGCVFAGVQAFSCVGRRVLLRGCKLDSVNFRDAQADRRDLRGLRAARRGLRLGEAARVRFPGSTLVGADFTRASCKDVDLRGARLGSADAAGHQGRLRPPERHQDRLAAADDPRAAARPSPGHHGRGLTAVPL